VKPDALFHPDRNKQQAAMAALDANLMISCSISKEILAIMRII
jgi:hypothetical protein